MSPTVPEAGPAGGRPWALMGFDGCELLVPQSEVRVLEPSFEVTAANEVDGQAGWLAVRGESLPVYCLTRDLSPLPGPTVDRRVCVVLRFGPVSFGLLCSRVESVAGEALRSFPLPAVMRAPYAAAEGLGIYRERVIAQSSAQALLRYVGHLNAQAAVPQGVTTVDELFS